MIAQDSKRSLVAMVWGWVACNTFMPILIWMAYHAENTTILDVAGMWMFFAACSVPVVFAAWLLICLPADCLIPESGFLRAPWVAAVLGASSGILTFLLPVVFYQMSRDLSSWLRAIGILRDPESWPFFGGAAIAGLTSAIHLSLHRLKTDNLKQLLTLL